MLRISRNVHVALFLGAIICFTGIYVFRGVVVNSLLTVATTQIKDTREAWDGIKEDDQHPLKDGDIRKSSEVFVIIVSQWRFGSSIVGEIFNRNPNVFYVYEPLWVFSEEASRLDRYKSQIYDNGVSPKDNYRRLLRGIGRCNFSNKFVSIMNTYGGKVRNKMICENTAEEEMCNMPSANWLVTVCKRSGGRVATKVNHVDLSVIKPLIVEDRLNIKIVYVVRDPRGAAASRVHYDMVENPSSVDLVALSDLIPNRGRLEPLGYLNNTRPDFHSLAAMCDFITNNYRPPSKLPPWLRNRYMVVRFEDFAEDPERIIHKIYNFIDLPLPSVAMGWVVGHTNATHDPDDESGMFWLEKNAKEVAGRWMNDLTELEIGQVEEICKESMLLLGYKTYDELKKTLVNG